MKYAALLFLTFANSAISSPRAPSIYSSYCSLMERVVSGPQSSSAINRGLDLLQRVALGSGDEIKSELEARLGLKPAQLRELSFKEAEARSCALRKIGETGLPEALNFLSRLKLTDFAADTTQQIWPAAQIALRDVRLRKIADPQSKNEFLETVLTEPHDAVSNSAIGHWAVDELCDRGALTSLAVIQKAIRNRMSGHRDEDEIAFCEARIQIVRRNPDRIKALASVLTLDNVAEDTRLKLWAICQLNEMHLAEADAELDRFARDISKLPEQSKMRQRMSLPGATIQELQNRRHPPIR